MNDTYNEVKEYFRDNPDVTVSEGRGAQGLKYNNKMFVMFYKGDLTIKVKPATAVELIETGKALPHDPGTGKPMKDRVLIPFSDQKKWIEFCKLSLSENKI